jgi:hypothetical protein
MLGLATILDLVKEMVTELKIKTCCTIWLAPVIATAVTAWPLNPGEKDNNPDHLT